MATICWGVSVCEEACTVVVTEVEGIIKFKEKCQWQIEWSIGTEEWSTVDVLRL